MRELDGRAAAADGAAIMPTVATTSLDRLGGMSSPVGRTAIADPEADAEGALSPALRIFAADDFAGRDEGRWRVETVAASADAAYSA